MYTLIRGTTALLKVLPLRKIVYAYFRKNPKQQKVLFLAAFFPENAGYHYRVAIWAGLLRGKGYKVAVKQVYNPAQLERYKTGMPPSLMVMAMFKRWLQCLSAFHYDVAIVRRELLLYNDYGNLFIEKLLLAANPHAILDFDDDISAAKREPRPISTYGRLMLESPNKFLRTMEAFPALIVGSRYLKQMALVKVPEKKSHQVAVVPTCVDYERYPPKVYQQERTFTFGWIGNDYNLRMLPPLIPVFNQLAKQYKIQLLVISGKGFHPTGAIGFEVINKKWSLATQIKDMMDIDIGLMPVDDNEAGKGKCGFKLIQYMGLGIVSVASAVAANAEIVDHGLNGFLVPQNNWYDVLAEVLSQSNRYPQIGKAAREKIQQHYSFTAYIDEYVRFIERNALTALKEGGKGISKRKRVFYKWT